MSIEVGSAEYIFLLILTIILIVGKGILWLYLLTRIIEYKKIRGTFEIDFVFGVFVVVLALFVSRILYLYVDFFLTGFDMEKYLISPNTEWWKAASIIYLVGIAILLFIIDKKALNFKFKGIMAYWILGIAIFKLLYPINTTKDHELVATLEAVGVFFGILMFPIIFFYLGIKTPRIRKIAFIFAFGITIFIIGATLTAESIVLLLTDVFRSNVRIYVWTFSITFKLIGLTMVTYSCTKFY